MNIVDTDLTVEEHEKLSMIRAHSEENFDFILDNNYTGRVDEEHMEEIIRSLKVSFVNQRSICMRDFGKGLNLYGIHDLILCNPDLFSTFFLIDFEKDMIPDSNYLFSLLKPVYSEMCASKGLVEELMMDNFQDMLNSIEDSPIEGFEAATAWAFDDKEGTKETCKGREAEEHFEKVPVTVPGIMGWLTGMRHKTLCKADEEIIVHFDHDCLDRNAKHTVCYPVVGACGRELFLPVAHMKTPQAFQDIFIMAYCKSQAFDRH